MIHTMVLSAVVGAGVALVLNVGPIVFIASDLLAQYRRHRWKRAHPYRPNPADLAAARAAGIITGVPGEIVRYHPSTRRPG